MNTQITALQQKATFNKDVSALHGIVGAGSYSNLYYKDPILVENGFIENVGTDTGADSRTVLKDFDIEVMSFASTQYSTNVIVGRYPNESVYVHPMESKKISVRVGETYRVQLQGSYSSYAVAFKVLLP